MNDPREFDDIARQKLTEREFAFEEANWTAMRGLLDDQRGKRHLPVWWITGALLLAVPMAWWTLREETPTGTPGEVAEANIALPPALAGIPAPGDPLSVRHSGNSLAPNEMEQAQKAEAATNERVRSSNEVNKHKEAPTVAAQGADMASVSDHGRPEETAPVAPAQAEAPFVAGSENTTEGNVADTPFTSPAPAEMTAAESASPLVSDTNEDPEEARTGDEPPMEPVLATPVVQSDAIIEAQSQDTTLAVPAVPPPTTWVATSTAHWEIGGVGGALRSTSDYTGANSADWSTDINGQWSPAFGVEAVRMGAHIGFGAGIHRSSYSERLRADRVTATEELHETTYALTPVQVTVPVVVDTIIIGGINYYQTVLVETTINQLTSSIDTTLVNVTLREARDEVTVVDYWEIPLLFDLHTSKGRWSFGARGGPMLGLLSGKRGAVPNAEDDGYSDLGDRAFRSMTFGYTARAYVRYRIANQWTLGIEPTVQGHFGNALDGGDLVRNNSAVGGLFSVNFRLP